MSNRSMAKLDWSSIFLYFVLVGMGWLNIYSASVSDTSLSLFDFNQPYGRQLIFIGLSVLVIIVILSVEAKFYERFSSIIYILSLLSLLLLFPFGKTISGATSWYSIGGLGLQPSEFAKAATALALANYISDIQTNMKLLGHQLKAFLIIFLPAIFIVPQPDPGSAVVFAAFFFVLHREGVSANYLWFGLSALALFVGTLLIGEVFASVFFSLLMFILFFIRKKGKKKKFYPFLIAIVCSIGFSYASNYIFNEVFEQRHRDRFNIVLGKSVDTRGIGYNTNQSQIAIGSGGFSGRGFLEGTQTKGGFVPEQHTDYIFSTVGEEWGFVGSTLVIIVFMTLMLRLLHIAERQRTQFSRVYGYGVVSILFVHFAVNIGMVIGLLPTVGIPLPFFSYGGSGLWGFTILLFIFLKLDSNRINEW